MRARKLRAFAGTVIGIAAASVTLAGDEDKPTKQPTWVKEFQTTEAADRARLAVGKDLFLREWVPGDPRAHGGDGLGPVYNATSCVACHRLGGIGGAGPNSANVQVAVATVLPDKNERPVDIPLDPLFKVHPGFRLTRSIVLHRYGVSPDYEDWRKDVGSGLARKVTISTVARNTPALFGAGLIDSISDDVLMLRAGLTHDNFPEIKGRARRDVTGRVTRFGWKGQIAGLDEFVRTACAVEMGLDVPGHGQSLNPTTPDTPAPGLDLVDAECDALTRYVASLAPPPRRKPLDRATLRLDQQGEELFQKIGCATCHAPRLGPAHGIYSDLLLHDMGDGLMDAAVYYGSPSAPVQPQERLAAGDPPATRSEWRTPPLWGLDHSAPYMHDGRADTVDAAIRLHDGEAAKPAELYAKLSKPEHQALRSFLYSLAAPSPDHPRGTPR